MRKEIIWTDGQIAKREKVGQGYWIERSLFSGKRFSDYNFIEILWSDYFSNFAQSMKIPQECIRYGEQISLKDNFFINFRK